MRWLVNNILSTDIMNDHDIRTFFCLQTITKIPPSLPSPQFSACLTWNLRPKAKPKHQRGATDSATNSSIPGVRARLRGVDGDVVDMVLRIWILSLLSKTGDPLNDTYIYICHHMIILIHYMKLYVLLHVSIYTSTRPVGEHFKQNVTGLDGHQGVNKMKWDECNGCLSSTVVSIQMGGAAGAVLQEPCRQRMTP